MAYDPSALSPISVTDASWALATLRMILRDTTTPERFTDSELSAVLELHTYTAENTSGVETNYYRPHVVAAALIRTDPDRAISDSIDNASQTRQAPGVIAAGILRDYGRIDDLIETATGTRPAPNNPRLVF